MRASIFHVMMLGGLVLACPADVGAQKARISLLNGDEAYRMLNFPKAISFYERHLSYVERSGGGRPDPWAFAQLGRSHWNMRNYKEAARWLDSLPREVLLSDRELLRKRAELFAIHRRYDSAYALMSGIPGFRARAEGFMDHRPYLKDTADWRLRYATVNTREYNEFSPLVFNGQVMWSTNEPLFASQRGVSGWDGKSMTRQAFVDQELELFERPFSDYSMGAQAPAVRVKRLAMTYGLSDNSLRAPQQHIGGTGSSVLSSSFQLRELGGLVHMGYNVGHATASAAVGRLYFSANIESRIRRDSVRTLRIVEAEVDKGKVLSTRFLSLGADDSIAIHPAIHPKGELLVYSAMKRGGNQYDLYLTHRDSSGNWSAPRALEALNTAGNEVFASFDASGVLYFSSDGRPGPGGLDIYWSALQADGSFGAVAILPHPVNSSYDDFGWTEIVGSNGRGYLTSNRYGTDDIFGYQRLFPTTRITGAVVDVSTGLRQSGVRVSVYQIEPDGVTRTLVGEDVTDSKGNYSVLGRPDRSYEVRLTYPGGETADADQKPQSQQVFASRENAWVSAAPLFVGRHKDGWVDANRMPAKKQAGTASIPGLDTLFLYTGTGLRKVDEVLKTMPKDFQLQSGDLSRQREFIINFDFDSDLVDAAGEQTVHELMEWLRVYPHARLMLVGHTDVEGTFEYNRNLSARRAANVKSHITQLGYPGERIGAEFFGESQPRIQTRRKNEARTNRRVEVYILR